MYKNKSRPAGIQKTDLESLEATIKTLENEDAM